MATINMGLVGLIGRLSRQANRTLLAVVAASLAIVAWIPAANAQSAGASTASGVASIPSTTYMDAIPSERSMPGTVRIEPVEEDYRIGTQDLLQVQVLGIDALQREARVNAKGMIGMPLIGAVHVAGLTTAEAEAMISGLYRKDYLQNPEVSVFVKEYTRQTITMDGAIGKPGVYPLRGPTTLLQAIANAGGPGSLSDVSNVVLFRMEDNERRAIKFDVGKIRSAEAPDPLMQAGDLVVVNRSPGRVAIRDSLLGDILGIFNPFTYVRP